MFYSLLLPKLSDHAGSIRIEILYARPGTNLPIGAKLADISMDLSKIFAQNCPPISFHRIVLREKLFLRDWQAAPGQICAPQACIAVFSDSPTEPATAAIARAARIMTASITYHPGMWAGGAE